MGIPVGNAAPDLKPIDFTFDGGRQDVPVREFTNHMRKLALRLVEGEDVQHELLRLCVPSITDDELDQLTDGNQAWIIAYCGRRLAEVTEALKNVGGAAEAETPTSPSAPMTNTNTPSRGSRGRSGKTGSSKRNARSGRPSLRSTV